MSNQFLFAQFVMRKAKIVGASDQIHPGFQCLQTTSRVTAFASEHGKPFPHRSIEPLNESRIQDRSSLRSLQQRLRLLFLSKGHLPSHLNDPFLLGVLDHGCNAQIFPHA